MPNLIGPADNGTILITGASGFVGRSLTSRLELSGRSCRPVGRLDAGKVRGIGSIDGETRWDSCLEGIDSVVHLAARVHVMREHSADSWAAFRQTNVDGTRRLAQEAARAGVRRLVYISSIKVNGELTRPGRPFTTEDIPDPQDAYGCSKWEAERALGTIAEESGLEVVIIRPPLVYGPGAKANFRSLLRAVAQGIPLPLGSIRNRRSLVALDTLVDMIITCIDHPAATNQTFLVSDGEDLSTPELIRRLARAIGRPARMFPMPPALLIAGASLFGKHDMAQRLCGSLQVDISKTRKLLGWKPPISVDTGLALVARWYLEHKGMGNS